MPSQPSSNPLSNPDQDSAEFLGLNLDAFRELLAFADAAAGFTLAIAEVNFASDGDLLVQALQNHELAQTVEVLVLDFGDQASFSLLAALKTALANQPLAPNRKRVLLVRGLATAIGVKGDYPKFLSDLNYSRDQLAVQVPYPLVLMLPDYAVDRLGQYAKDLWTWKSGLFHFRTTGQRVETAQTQLRQPHPTLAADSRPVKQERIEQLERLLAEQASGPPTTPKKTLIAMALELGQAYLSLSEYEPARGCYHRAFRWAEVEGKQGQLADALHGLGQVSWLKDDNSAKALNRFEQAMALYRATGDRLGEANTLKEIGDVLQFLDRRSEALQNYEQAMQLYRATGARLGEANTLRAIGDVLQFLDRRSEALQNYEQAMQLYRATGDRLGEANTLKAVGDVLQFLDRRNEALQHYEQALELFRAVGDRLGEANTLQAVGDVLQFLKRSNEALQHYEQALELFRAVGARLGEANTLLMLGRISRKLGNRDQALLELQQATEIYKAIEAVQGEANGYFFLGESHFNWGDYPNAVQLFQIALPLFQRTGDRYSQAMTWYNLGNAQVRQGQQWDARTAYETARDLYREAGLDDQAQSCEQAIKALSQQVVVAPPKAPTIGETKPTTPDWLQKSMPTTTQSPARTPKTAKSNTFLIWMLVGLGLALLLWWLL